MAYKSDITALSPDHFYTFDGDYLDSVGSDDGTNTGCDVTQVGICEDTTYSMRTDTDGDNVVLVGSIIADQINNFMYAGWFRVNVIQQPPVRIIGEGGGANSCQIVMGFGNNLIFEVDDDTDTLQIYSDVPLETGRNYHLCIGFNSSNKLLAYLDGIPQLNTTDDQGSVALITRNDFRFGGSTNTADFAIGGTLIKIVSTKNGRYNCWATWSGGVLTTTQIREELFEKGALTDLTITDQAGLTAIADTVRNNAPCCIRITGNTDLTLTADNVTFDPLASIHIQYTGTGTLTWINTNGSNASIKSTTTGGTINIINRHTLTITGLEYNSEVRVYEEGTTTELAGQENVTTGTFTADIDASLIKIKIISLSYKNVRFNDVVMTKDISFEITQFYDRVYRNP